MFLFVHLSRDPASGMSSMFNSRNSTQLKNKIEPAKEKNANFSLSFVIRNGVSKYLCASASFSVINSVNEKTNLGSSTFDKVVLKYPMLKDFNNFYSSSTLISFHSVFEVLCAQECLLAGISATIECEGYPRVS